MIASGQDFEYDSVLDQESPILDKSGTEESEALNLETEGNVDPS
jgi:hypothetical protein